VAGSLPLSKDFRPFDVTNPSTYEFNRPFESDIFTMIYFLSEVFVHKDAVTRFLKTCFARMKKGALLIVIDFKHADVQSWIDTCAKQGGLEGSGKEEELVMDTSEQKSILKRYSDKFNIEPKIRSQVFYRLFRKT